MALVVADRVKETTNTTGTGTLTLAGAVSGFQSFAVIGDGNTTYYTISSNSNWEVGIGTYTSSGTTLSRDTVLASSASGAKITVAAGAEVFVSYPAGKSINQDASGNTYVPNLGATTASSGKFSSLTNTALTSGRVVYSTTNGAETDSANLTFDGTTLTANTLNLTNKLDIAYGGTNATATPTAGAVAYGTGTAYAFNTAGSSGQPLLSGGAGAPTFGTLSVAAGGTGQTSYTDGQLLIGNTTGNTLTKATLTAGSGITITNGSGAITIASTGGSGTVTSVGLSVPTFLSVANSPITTSGTLAVTLSGTALPTTSGGTGLTSFTANGVVYASSTSALTTGSSFVFDGTNVGIGTSSPGSKLDVKGTLRLSGSTSGYVGIAPAAAAGSTTYTLPSADGTSGQFLKTNGSATLSWATAGPISDTQTFTSSGTWTKPSGATWVRVEIWGAGGSGRGGTAGGGGGGGGAYATQVFAASSLGSTETVTIGAGGTATSGGTNGNAGGDSTFGSWLKGVGGAAGTTTGGQGGAGTQVQTVATNNYNDAAGGVGTSGTGSASGTAGGKSYFGGGGGGGAGSATAGTGGTSVYGGAGGAGATSGTATSGSQPGGGGGGNYNGTSGAGGDGKCVVYTW